PASRTRRVFACLRGKPERHPRLLLGAQLVEHLRHHPQRLGGGCWLCVSEPPPAILAGGGTVSFPGVPQRLGVATLPLAGCISSTSPSTTSTRHQMDGRVVPSMLA